MTNSEVFHLTGTLPLARIEALLDIEAALSDLDVEPYLDEAIAQYPEEDFLAKIVERINEFAKTARGDRKEDLKLLATDLEEIASSVRTAAEYGVAELKKALTALGK